jgi:nucleoid-associated protein YgaU
MWKSLLKSLKISESYISMALGLLVVVVIGILLFNFFTNRGKSNLPTSQETQQTEGQPSTAGALPTNYTVSAGESLWSIAEKSLGSGYNWLDIAKENNLSDPNHLEAGQVLVIPKVSPILPTTGTGETQLSITGNSYTVVSGDNLWDIAVKAYGDGFKWAEIAKVNNLLNPDFIHAGNVLVLPR